MKKRNRIRAVIIAAVLIFLMPNVVRAAHAAPELEEPKDYKDMLQGVDYLIDCVEDDSWSMTHTFSYERSLIEKNLAETEFESKTTIGAGSIWKPINDLAEKTHQIILVSDLWDTSDETLNEARDMSMFVLVPYWSDNEEAREHIDNVMWNEIFEYWDESEVTVIYLDGHYEVYARKVIYYD